MAKVTYGDPTMEKVTYGDLTMTKVTYGDLTMEYPTRLPRSAAEIPAGKVLVHNRVHPPCRRQGWRGSRYWYQPPSDRPRPCPCGWAPELGGHYVIDQ